MIQLKTDDSSISHRVGDCVFGDCRQLEQAVVPAARRRLSQLHHCGRRAKKSPCSSSLAALAIQQLVGFRSKASPSGSFNTGGWRWNACGSTAGDENTANGAVGALLLNTTGAFNTANGALALLKPTRQPAEKIRPSASVRARYQ